MRRRYTGSLRARRFGNRILVGAKFSASVRTLPGAHPASYNMNTGSIPVVKQLGRGVNHPPPFSAEVKERVELYFYSLSGLLWSYRVKIVFFLVHTETTVFLKGSLNNCLGRPKVTLRMRFRLSLYFKLGRTIRMSHSVSL